MRSNAPRGEEITQHLQEAIDRLRVDLVRVELWAAALHGFQRPVPNYEPDDRMLLPPQRRADGEKS